MIRTVYRYPIVFANENSENGSRDLDAAKTPGCSGYMMKAASATPTTPSEMAVVWLAAFFLTLGLDPAWAVVPATAAAVPVAATTSAEAESEASPVQASRTPWTAEVMSEDDAPAFWPTQVRQAWISGKYCFG